MHSHKLEQVNKETSIKPANPLKNEVQHSQAKTEIISDSLVQYVMK